jgi:hypothetical protein
MVPELNRSDTRRQRRAGAGIAAVFHLAAAIIFIMSADAAENKPAVSDGAPGQVTASPAGANPGEAAKPSPPAADPAKPAGQVEKKPETWSEAEIADARAHCAVILKRIHAVALPHGPIREGACGAPAPVELISIGQNPEVALSPPAIVRCDLAEQLANWFEHDIQPLARKHLKSNIVRIETMSSYSCRNSYGRKSTKLSEHGLANAVDIGGFVMASAKTAEVLDDWGKPQREIRAEAEAQKQAAEKAAAETAKVGVAGRPAQGALPSAVGPLAGAAAAGLARSTIIEGVPQVAASSNGSLSRLGGPELAAKALTAGMRATASPNGGKDNPDPEMRAFLHEAHDAACRIFGTTLGPEANADHRNHFHVDMAARKFTKICD